MIRKSRCLGIRRVEVYFCSLVVRIQPTRSAAVNKGGTRRRDNACPCRTEEIECGKKIDSLQRANDTRGLCQCI